MVYRNLFPFLWTIIKIVYHSWTRSPLEKATNLQCDFMLKVLNFRSFHPLSLRFNIPFSQFLRVKRNCTKLSDFQSHWHILNKFPACDRKPRVAMRRSKSIRNLVMHPDIERKQNNSEVSTEHFKCLKCAACRYVSEGREFINPQDNKWYLLRQLTTCCSQFCIYIISCSCKLIYIGNTSHNVKIRILDHVARIKKCSIRSAFNAAFS